MLLAHALGISTKGIADSAMVHFWARVVHALAYTFAIPWLRTLAFAAGFMSQACIAWHILVR